jgi:hypothetical protein
VRNKISGSSCNSCNKNCNKKLYVSVRNNNLLVSVRNKSLFVPQVCAPRCERTRSPLSLPAARPDAGSEVQVRPAGRRWARHCVVGVVGRLESESSSLSESGPGHGT